MSGPRKRGLASSLREHRGFWQGRRVLVTGHTGFKGAWLALWLHRLGAEVTGFAAAPPTAPSLFELARMHELVDDVRGDVRDRDAVHAAVARARPEVVFHLAAQAIVRAALEDPAATYDINVLGTAHLLDAAREAAIVCVTSDKCYAPGPERTARTIRSAAPTRTRAPKPPRSWWRAPTAGRWAYASPPRGPAT